jgi:hypothetical protein
MIPRRPLSGPEDPRWGAAVDRYIHDQAEEAEEEEDDGEG